MVTVPHKMVELKRMSDYRGFTVYSVCAHTDTCVVVRSFTTYYVTVQEMRWMEHLHGVGICTSSTTHRV